MSRLTDDQKSQVQSLLAELVRIKSVNENAEQANRDRAEREMADYVERAVGEIGMTVRRVPFAPGRDNLVAHRPVREDARSFALQSHMDTVSVTGMTLDPFAAEVRNGRMWGRGTCDTKGSLAAFLTGLRIAHERGLEFVDNVYLVATCAEETGCEGARVVCEHPRGLKSAARDGVKVDAMVVGEPTGCRVVTAHKGTCWYELTSAGESCHASSPGRGHNAVYAMAKAMRFIEDDYIPSLSAQRHPLLGEPTLSVGTIRGGVATNIVPATCSANLDFRILPAQDPGAVRDDFLARLARAVDGERFTMNEIHIQPGVESPADDRWVRALLASAGERTGQNSVEGVNYFADSGPFHAAGITCVLFGPGDIAQAHTADEYLELEQLYLATEIVLDWLETGATKSLVS